MTGNESSTQQTQVQPPAGWQIPPGTDAAEAAPVPAKPSWSKGKVTAVSATSITVASIDGYTRSYVVGSSTVVDNGNDQISSVAAGHTVSVVATGSGDTATATALSDQTLNGAPQGGQPGQRPGGQAGTGTTTTS